MRALCGVDALCARAPWRGFVPLFGHIHFQIFEGGPLLPAWGGSLDVYSNGKYVCFFMLGGTVDKSLEENGSEEEIIKAYQQLNKKAVNAVKKKLK